MNFRTIQPGTSPLAKFIQPISLTAAAVVLFVGLGATKRSGQPNAKTLIH